VSTLAEGRDLHEAASQMFGARALQDASAPQSMTTVPVTQIPFPWRQLAAQAAAKVAYFDSALLDSSTREGVAKFAAVVSQTLGGSFLKLGTFTVNITLGTPGVSLPVVVDTGSPISFVQGPECASCPGNGVCENNPFEGESTCPFQGQNYVPAQSNTANPNPSCGECPDPQGFGMAGCLGAAFSPQDTCQFKIQFGAGNAAGQLVSDVLSVGSASTGSSKALFGTTIFQASFEGTAGLVGFGPTDTSLPFQLKQVRSISSLKSSKQIRLANIEAGWTSFSIEDLKAGGILGNEHSTRCFDSATYRG
jgi:hypothetical protein